MISMIRNYYANMDKRKRRIFYIVIGAAVLLFVVMQKIDLRGKAERLEAVPVRVMAVEKRTIQSTLDYAGTIKGVNQTPIYPKATGKITEIIVTEGSEIRKNDVIAYFDRDVTGHSFKPAVIESPIDGTVGRIDVDRGESISPQEPIGIVADISKVRIEVSVDERFAGRLTIGQSATVSVDAYPDDIFEGKVTSIAEIIDPASRTFPIDITADNPHRKLKPGMFARTKVILDEKKDVPVIEKSAVEIANGEKYVFTASGGVASRTKITLGIDQGPWAEVTSGVNVGDLVVVMGQQRLKDGASVIVEERPFTDYSGEN